MTALTGLDLSHTGLREKAWTVPYRQWVINEEIWRAVLSSAVVHDCVPTIWYLRIFPSLFSELPTQLRHPYRLYIFVCEQFPRYLSNALSLKAMFAHCSDPLWQRDDLSQCFEVEYVIFQRPRLIYALAVLVAFLHHRRLVSLPLYSFFHTDRSAPVSSAFCFQ